MSIPEILRYGVAALLTGLLVWAALSDIRARRIPNAAVLSTLLLFAVWAVTDRGATLGSSLAAAAIGFAVGYGLYLVNVMGAGDVKLFAAVALFVGLADLPLFALATALTGGAMAIVSLASRPRRAAAMFTLRGQGDFGRGIPYGVAIAVGGAIAVWGGLTGVLPLGS